jgi:hypothetical protein
MLWHKPDEASTENLKERIKQYNPAIVHIAGHNHNKGTDRLVGFSEGGDGLAEVKPEELADMIVNAAVLGACLRGSSCALSCVLVNACSSVGFAAAILAAAKKKPSLANLQVICWPHLTDDIVCQQFVHGFYEFFGAVGQARSDWLEMCFTSGRLNVAGRKVQLTPELMRGDPAEIVLFEPPQLLDVGSVEAALAGAETKREKAGSGRWMVEVSSAVDKEVFHRLLEIIHEFKPKAPHTKTTHNLQQRFFAESNSSSADEEAGWFGDVGRSITDMFCTVPEVG